MLRMNRTRSRVIFALLVVFQSSLLHAQGPANILQTDALRPFGLQGMRITSLTTEVPQFGYPYFPLIASTDSEGIYFTEMPGCANWQSLGLVNKKVRSLTVQHHTIGPVPQSFIFAGVLPDYQEGDSTLIYRMEYYFNSAWGAADSGVDRKKLITIDALDAFYVDLPINSPSNSSHFAFPIIMGGDQGLYAAYDTYEIWGKVPFPGTVSIRDVEIAKRYYGEEIFAVGRLDDKAAIFRSNDLGSSWSIDSLSVSPDSTVFSVVMNPIHSDTVLVGTSGRILISTDSGKTFTTSVLVDPEVDFRALAVDYNSPSDVFAAGVRNPNTLAFFHSRDGGVTWDQIEPIPPYPIPGATSMSILTGDWDSAEIFIGTDDGVWRYAYNRPHDEDTISWSCSRAGWNLVSIPQIAEDFSKMSLFPNAISDAFTYANGTYIREDTLSPGQGYWIKLPPGDQLWIAGSNITNDTLEVHAGWNMIGSLSDPVEVVAIEQSPPGIIISNVLEYDGGYKAVNYLLPLKAYWIKVSQEGTLRVNIPSR